MAGKIVLTVLVSIILTAIVVSLVNVGTSIVIEETEQSKYCEELDRWKPDDNVTAEEQEAIEKCDSEYEAMHKAYNQKRYYIFAGFGFVFLITGLFVSILMLQITGLASGGILILEGIVTNFQNKIVVFISLLVILVVFGILAWKVIRKKD